MSKEELIEKTDDTISELVHSKSDLQKAYNYYSGIRDAELFRYLEDNYGLGNATQVEFTPLIKKHIDALIGEFLGVPIHPKISCKDTETISNIYRDKQISITKDVYTFLQGKIKNSLLQFIELGLMTDTSIKQQLDNLVEDLDTNFVSEYEIAALNVVRYIMQSRTTDMTTNLRHALLDLLIAGYCVFRCKESFGGNNIKIEVLDPRNVFIDRNPESIYIKDSYRVVIRKWLNKNQILNMYGKDLSPEDRKIIKEEWEDHFRNYSSYWETHRPGDVFPELYIGLDYGKEVIFGEPFEDNRGFWYDKEVLPVYEIEWIEVDKDFTMQRYKTVRIAEDIYILKGKDENVVRTKDNPLYCTLSVNGIYLTNRTNKPYSLMKTCMSLLDLYDVLNFVMYSILANGGTVGDYIDMSMLPAWLGTTPEERILKYMAYKKNGAAILDTSQEGRLAAGLSPINTIFNGFDDTIKAPTIQAILLAIQHIEETVSSITGVFRERLNGIELRDAVTNIKQGVLNSFIITKHYYLQMDLVIEELLTDSLNVAKRVYKNGLTGTLILGDKYLKIFTALPEYFTLTDFDIHVSNSSDTIKDLETVKQLIPEFIKSQALAPEIIFEALTSDSLPELKWKALKAMKKLKEETNLIQQLQQQGEQLQLQLQQTLQQLLLSLLKIEQLNEQKLQIESQKVLAEAKNAWYEALTDRDYKTKMADNDAKRVEIEWRQLFDGNPYNDKVKQ